jgi:predicted unusual protein kinase regulating ubiquinone biosynthesis (AarF/ABC1/UbiB family)
LPVDQSGPESNGAPTGDGISQGRLRRSAPLVGLVAKTAGEAVVVGLRSRLTGADPGELHARTAERYAEVLGRSKGALMKAGQMVSFMSLGPAVPEEFRSAYQTALARLQDDAPPMHADLARSVLERELGRKAEEAFAAFDWTPLAAASIGQVHAARLHDGRRVAVKIQYPGVAEAIRADLDNTELLATFFGLFRAVVPGEMRTDVRGAAKEIEARISEELDYRREAANQTEFARIYRVHPFIHVPEVVGRLSTGRVLTQELAEGRRFAEALQAPQELRDRWGETIFRFWYGPFQRFGCFNADPHPGNYLFHDDGTVSFLDFGCVKRFSPERIGAMNAVSRAVRSGDRRATWRACIEAGYFRSSDGLTPEEIFEYWREPYQMYGGEQPFTITPEFVARFNERLYSPTGPSGKAMRRLTAAGEHVAIMRIDFGLLSVLAELRATTDWGSIEAEYRAGAAPLTPLGKLEREVLERRAPAGSGHG